jgi:hypothetical protein
MHGFEVESRSSIPETPLLIFSERREAVELWKTAPLIHVVKKSFRWSNCRRANPVIRRLKYIPRSQHQKPEKEGKAGTFPITASIHFKKNSRQPT